MNPLPKRVYDPLKFLAQILLPALGALYFGLAGIWGLPAAEQVVGTIVVVDTFLGVILGLSARVYSNSDERFDGTIEISETPTKKTFAFDLNGEAEKLEGKNEAVFKVQKE